MFSADYATSAEMEFNYETDRGNFEAQYTRYAYAGRVNKTQEMFKLEEFMPDLFTPEILSGSKYKNSRR